MVLLFEVIITAVEVNAVAVVAVVDDDERLAFCVTEVDALGDVNKSASAKLSDLCVIIGSYNGFILAAVVSAVASD